MPYIAKCHSLQHKFNISLMHSTCIVDLKSGKKFGNPNSQTGRKLYSETQIWNSSAESIMPWVPIWCKGEPLKDHRVHTPFSPTPPPFCPLYPPLESSPMIFARSIITLHVIQDFGKTHQFELLRYTAWNQRLITHPDPLLIQTPPLLPTGNVIIIYRSASIDNYDICTIFSQYTVYAISSTKSITPYTTLTHLKCMGHKHAKRIWHLKTP